MLSTFGCDFVSTPSEYTDSRSTHREDIETTPKVEDDRAVAVPVAFFLCELDSCDGLSKKVLVSSAA